MPIPYYTVDYISIINIIISVKIYFKKEYSNINNEVTFIGQGYYFQIWEPKAAIDRQKKSRDRLIKRKKTLGSIIMSNSDVK